MGDVTENGEEIVITGNGRPAPRPAPHGKKPNMAFGRNRDKIRILGDIVARCRRIGSETVPTESASEGQPRRSACGVIGPCVH